MPTFSPNAADYTTNQTSGSGGSYAPYAAGISAVSTIASGFASTSAFEAQQEANTKNYLAQLKFNTDAAILNVGNLVTSYELQQVQNKEQIENINSVLGDKLSERGLTAMKEAALLRTAAAETGTSGGTTDFAIKEAFINENMDKANIVSSARQQKRAIFTGMNVGELGLQHQIDSLLLGGQQAPSAIADNTNSFATALAGGLGVATNTLNLLPVSERAKVFGIGE